MSVSPEYSGPVNVVRHYAPFLSRESLEAILAIAGAEHQDRFGQVERAPIPCAHFGCEGPGTQLETRRVGKSGIGFYYLCAEHSRPDEFPADDPEDGLLSAAVRLSEMPL